jgi:hypothetical protein
MNKQRIPQRIGIIFLLITICATNIASGQQKNNSTTIDNLKTKEAFTVYARVTSYSGGDPDTNGQTSTCTPIKEITDRGLKCIAVGEGIPYLSVITFYDAQGRKQVGVAMDTGSHVKSGKAAKELATIKGFGKNSREYNAPVIDIYAKCDLTNEWSNVTVIPYTGPDIVPKKDDKKEVVRQKILMRNQQLDLIKKKAEHLYPELASQ